MSEELKIKSDPFDKLRMTKKFIIHTSPDASGSYLIQYKS